MSTQELQELRQFCDELEDKVDVLEAALNKINTVRNSIIGGQMFNWSEHAYPLVAALNMAGFKGRDYPEARANLGTLIEQRDVAEAETLRLTRMMVYCDGCSAAPGESCSKTCTYLRNSIPPIVNVAMPAPMERAILHERESCARLVESSIVGGRAWNEDQAKHAEAAQHIAKAIRARGHKGGKEGR